jgi:hypothetical protein
MRGGVAALAVLAVAGVGVGAAAAATPTGGPIALFATVGNGPSEKILIAGAIGDWGHVQTVDKNGKPDENGNLEKVTLKKGTFLIDSTGLNKGMANPKPAVASDVTCSVAMSATGPVKLLDGTGLYKGISGTAKLTVTFTGVGGRYQSGAQKGQCVRGDTDPLFALGSVIGRGTVTFG